MQLIVCEYCGTEYKDSLSKCPLCGKSASGAVGQPVRENGGEAKAAASSKARKERIPRWMWMVSCIVLAAAVLICTIYILFAMGAFSGGEKEPFHEPVTEQTETPNPDLRPPVEPEPPEEAVPIACTDLVLSESVLVIEEKQGFAYLSVVPEPLDCEETIFFSISDPSVAEIEASDSLSVMITAISPGTAIVTASCGDVTKTCTVLCQFDEEQEEEPETPEDETEITPEMPEEPTAEPALNKADFTFFRPGEEFLLQVENVPENATITYTSSNPAAATVSANGLVTAVGSGTSTIKVSVEDVTLEAIARCNLADSAETGNGETSVAQPSADPNAVYTVSHTDVTLKEGDAAFTVTLLQEDGTAVAGEVWTSTNSRVCTVDANGKVVASGVTGNADVVCTFGGKTYICTVRCYYP